jgi:CubicO group peptidase (beta-lactamase class C family)
MKKGMAALLVAGLVGWTSVAWADDPLPRAKPEDVGLSSERLARIATFAKAEIDAGQIPGAVIAVARRGKLVYFEAFGQSDKKAGTPMTTDTIFSLASMTKPMTTVAALQLYEQGRLLIDDPLAKYLPKFAEMKVAVWDDKSEGVRDTVPAARQITIQDLMRHTSGLSYGGSGTSDAAQAVCAVEQRRLAHADCHRAVGQDGCAAAGPPAGHGMGIQLRPRRAGVRGREDHAEVAGRGAAGDDLETARHGRYGFVVPADKAARYARGIQDIPSPLVPDQVRMRGGCTVGTPGDYLRFASMLLAGGKLGDTRLLGRKTVEYMTANQLPPGTRSQLRTNFADWGFGLSVAVRTHGRNRARQRFGRHVLLAGRLRHLLVGDPKEELVAVWMAPTPVGPTQVRYRHTMNALVNQAIVD